MSRVTAPGRPGRRRPHDECRGRASAASAGVAAPCSVGRHTSCPSPYPSGASRSGDQSLLAVVLGLAAHCSGVPLPSRRNGALLLVQPAGKFPLSLDKNTLPVTSGCQPPAAGESHCPAWSLVSGRGPGPGWCGHRRTAARHGTTRAYLNGIGSSRPASHLLQRRQVVVAPGRPVHHSSCMWLSVPA